MENSIEEDITLIEKSLCDKDTIIQYHYWVGTDFLNAVERIVADYKIVLKENEELLEVKVSASAHNRILELEKENEELKEEIGVDYTTVYLKGVYDEREKQQKEIKEKNKIINLMAEHIFYNQDDTFPLAYSIKDTKDYFENKAKKR